MDSGEVPWETRAAISSAVVLVLTRLYSITLSNQIRKAQRDMLPSTASKAELPTMAIPPYSKTILSTLPPTLRQQTFLISSHLTPSTHIPVPIPFSGLPSLVASLHPPHPIRRRKFHNPASSRINRDAEWSKPSSWSATLIYKSLWLLCQIFCFNQSVHPRSGK